MLNFGWATHGWEPGTLTDLKAVTEMRVRMDAALTHKLLIAPIYRPEKEPALPKGFEIDETLGCRQ